MFRECAKYVRLYFVEINAVVTWCKDELDKNYER